MKTKVINIILKWNCSHCISECTVISGHTTGGRWAQPPKSHGAARQLSTADHSVSHITRVDRYLFVYCHGPMTNSGGVRTHWKQTGNNIVLIINLVLKIEKHYKTDIILHIGEVSVKTWLYYNYIYIVYSFGNGISKFINMLCWHHIIKLIRRSSIIHHTEGRLRTRHHLPHSSSHYCPLECSPGHRWRSMLSSHHQLSW